MEYPDRIDVNTAKKKSIKFYHSEVHDPAKFNFRRQKENYENISAALASIGAKLNFIGVDYFDSRMKSWGPKPTNTLGGSPRVRFVAVAGPIHNPFFIWYKYEGINPMGAQNMVIFDGREYRTSEFLRLIEKQGTAILDELRFKAIIWES